jgi:APA family basic amino acid/polyamine antiporter
MLIGAWVLAFRAVIVSYDGWYEPAYFSEESVDPGRTVPRSLVFGVLLVMGIYLLVNAGLLHALGIGNLQGAELPVADAARRIAGNRADFLVVGLSLLALLPMTNASLLGGARICYGLGRDFLQWRGAERVNSGGTPWISTLVTAGIAMALIATGTFDALLAMAGVFMVILYCSAYVSLIVLRRQEPHTKRPFKLFAYPWIPLLLLTIGALFLGAIAISDTTSTLAALGLLAISYPVYRVFARRI